VSGDRVREVLGNRGEDIDADFQSAALEPFYSIKSVT